VLCEYSYVDLASSSGHSSESAAEAYFGSANPVGKMLPGGIGLVVAVPIAWAAGTQWLLQFDSTPALPVATFAVLLVGVLGLAAIWGFPQ